MWLLADSHAPGGGAMAQLLRACGAEVTAALSGSALLVEAATRRYDAVALDPVLVAPPGWAEVARRLRAADPTIGLVLVCAAPSPELVINALRLGFDDVVPQPPGAGEVCATSCDLVARVSARRARAGEEATGAATAEADPDALTRGASLLAESIAGALAPGPGAGDPPPPLGRLLVHLEAALPASSSRRRDPVSVASALEGAIALSRPLLPAGVALTGRQESAIPRVTVRSARLRRVLASLLIFAGQRAAAAGRGEVALRWGRDSGAAFVAVSDGAKVPVTDPETPFRFPAAALGADPLACVSLHFCRAALRAESGDLTARWSEAEGLTLAARLPGAAGAGADWGPNLGANASGSSD